MNRAGRQQELQWRRACDKRSARRRSTCRWSCWREFRQACRWRWKRDRGRSWRDMERVSWLARAPMTPGCSRILLPPSSTCRSRQLRAVFDQQAVGDSLAGEAGAAGAKGHGDARLVAEGKKRANFVDGLGLDDSLGDQAIKAGVRGPGNEIDGADEDAVAGDKAVQCASYFFGGQFAGSDKSCSHWVPFDGGEDRRAQAAVETRRGRHLRVNLRQGTGCRTVR